MFDYKTIQHVTLLSCSLELHTQNKLLFRDFLVNNFRFFWANNFNSFLSKKKNRLVFFGVYKKATGFAYELVKHSLYVGDLGIVGLETSMIEMET